MRMSGWEDGEILDGRLGDLERVEQRHHAAGLDVRLSRYRCGRDEQALSVLFRRWLEARAELKGRRRHAP